ncbi:MAG: hypothetical protein ACTSQJ_11950 [Promethearchaeota archaeon]
MEIILNEIYDLIESLMKSDPAIYRVMLYDPNGTEIYQHAKTWNMMKKYTSVGAMIGQIFKNSHKFLGFMKNDYRDRFIFQWYFDNTIIISADSPYGFIILLCELDVDLGFVKNVLLRQGIPTYIKIMKPIQD